MLINPQQTKTRGNKDKISKRKKQVQNFKNQRKNRI